MRAEYTWNTLAAILTRWTVYRPDVGIEQVAAVEAEYRIVRKCQQFLETPAAVYRQQYRQVTRQSTVATTSTMMSAAESYHARGWCLIPMCQSGKQPAVRWKQYQTTRPASWNIRDWFGSNDSYGMAVVFGEISGYLGSRDFDDMESYDRWASAHPDLAATLPTVRTHRGRHVYFATDADAVARFRESIGKAGMNGAIHRPDGELRIGTGCYSLVPPTPHPKGGVYEWLIPLGDELPVVADFVAAGLY